MMASAKRVSREAYEDLCRLIQHWNENRLELFEISMPNENLEFAGIMRFYFQNSSNSKETDTEKVATKCIRVTNSNTTESVIKALVQKFRPDMRMLTNQSYSLYEVHANQDERKLESNENPLQVQLGWSRDDRDGRFLLRSETNSKSSPPKSSKSPKRRLSKRGKKSKKSESEAVRNDIDGANGSGRIARSLYNMMPESRFTRSISIKNRRNMLSRNSPDKLKKDNVTTDFKVYADFILPDAPTISLRIYDKDTSSSVVKTALDRYGIREDTAKYCLVQVTVPSFGSEPQLNLDYKEHLLGDNEHPTQVYSDWASTAQKGTSAQFQLRRRSTLLSHQRESRSRSLSPEDDPSIPALVEIFQGAQSPPQSPRRFELSLELTEIGSNVALLDPKSYICLTSGGIKPRHCVISSVDDIFTISPLDKTALIYVNGKFIKEPAFLPHNAELKLGDREMFRFFAPVGNKLYSSSMHTLPSNIGRPSSSRGLTSHSRQSSRSSLQRSDNISKAYSVEDIFSPGSSNKLLDSRLRDRAFSEHNLKVDDRSSSGYGSGRVQRKFSDPNFMAEDGSYRSGGRSKYGGSDFEFSAFSKKRHQGPEVKGHLDESAGVEWVLPASLSFYQAQENLLLQMMISEVNGYLLSYKLSPACSLYMIMKHHLSPDFQLSNMSERRKCFTLTIKNIIVLFKKSIKESRAVPGALAFWMANASEFLHMVTRDPQLAHYYTDYESSLTQVIHSSYKYFTTSMTRELGMSLGAFYDESPEADSEEGYISGGESSTSGGIKDPDTSSLNHSPLARPTSLTGMYWSVTGSKVRRRGRANIGDVLTTLSSTVSLLKHCKLNPTLSIVIFSALFRYVSAKLLNKLLGDSKLCTRAVAVKIQKRVERVKEWAEKEGMELPAENHLCLILQATGLLVVAKKLPEDVPHVFSNCSKLNSLQVRTLLHHCSIADSEQSINPSFAEQLVVLAQSHIDELLNSENGELRLEEDSNPDLPFVVPQRDYHSDTLRGIPGGLHDFLEPMVNSGLCKFMITPKEENPQGIWLPAERDKLVSPEYQEVLSSAQNTVHNKVFQPSHRLAAVPHSVQDVVVIHVNIKKEGNSLGISIIGGKNSTQHGDIGIYVKSMVEGGAAHLDGRIQPGDELLAVDNISLETCMQEEAAQILRGTGKIVNLMVAKQTAVLNGLGHLIGSPSPRYGRKLERIAEGPQARKSAKKQRREHRERAYNERHQGREFRLERRKPPLDAHLHQPRSLDHSGDTRLPPHANPQFAKWIMEQNHQLYSDTRTNSDVDLQSLSSLANIPERDHPVNPELSYIESNSRMNYEYSDRFRSDSPPVRDSSPAKELRTSSFTNFGSSVALPTMQSPVVSNRLPPVTRVESDAPIPTNSLKGKARVRDEFSSISSQLTMESQPMLTPFSQGQVSSQQQHQHLDKLSMDVMQHTQLSGSSFQGITSLIPRLGNQKSAPTPGDLSHLGRKGLKEFEMDDIALEKQRIQLMFYEQQKQKEQLDLEQMNKNLTPLSDDKEDEDNEDGNLSQEQLRQELESLEEMVIAQKKKYREVKFSREREELKLKEFEVKFREQEINMGAFAFSSGDQKRWQNDQKRLLRELENLKKEQNSTVQQIQYSERRAKTKLKAYETQASELRQQLCLATPPAPSPNQATRTAHETYDVVPSKLTSEYGKKGSTRKDVDKLNPTSSTVNELNWSDIPNSKTFSNAPGRAMSIEDMSAAVFEPPDLAREPMNTISASCLTEPTQDEPRHNHWPLYKPRHRAESSSDAAYNTESRGLNNSFRAVSVGELEGSQGIPPPSIPESKNNRIPIRREREGRSSPTKGSIYAIPEFNEMLQATYDVPTTRQIVPQQTTFLHAQPTAAGTQPGRHYSRNSRARGVQYTKVFLNQTTNSTPTAGSPKADSPRALAEDEGTVTTPDVIPMGFTSPVSPRNQKETTQSPVPRISPNIPSPQPPEGYYAVPQPAQLPSTLPQEAPPQHPRPALEGNDMKPSSPTVYDYPKNQVSRPESAASTRTIPSAVYDIPGPARKQGQRSPYEGVGLRQDNAQRGAGKPKPNGGHHRYGIVKPHSYSRSRPDPMSQQPTEKLRPYKMAATRVQRQQTEL